MADYPPTDTQNQQFVSDSGTRIRDLEEKHKLLKDRTLLIGQNLVEEREKTFKDLQDMKKEVFILKEEMLRMKEFIHRISQELSRSARKDELLILQRQFDLFRQD